MDSSAMILLMWGSVDGGSSSGDGMQCRVVDECGGGEVCQAAADSLEQRDLAIVLTAVYFFPAQLRKGASDGPGIENSIGNRLGEVAGFLECDRGVDVHVAADDALVVGFAHV